MTSPHPWEIRVRSIAQIGKIGRRTPQNLDTDYPSIFITVSEYLRDKSPRNGKQITGRKKRVYAFTEVCLQNINSLQTAPNSVSEDREDTEISIASENFDYSVQVSIQFERLTREFEVGWYTGLPSPEAFKCIFDFLSPKARTMQYWRVRTQTARQERLLTPNSFPGSFISHSPLCDERPWERGCAFTSYNTSGCFSKDPVTYRARKAILETMIRLP